MTTPALPLLALSVRQPWAWAACAGHKRVENRSHASVRSMGLRNLPWPHRIAIHASGGMTRDEYVDAAEFMAIRGVICPPPADLPRGAIVGAASICGIDYQSDDPWFFGPVGLAMCDAIAVTPIPALGALGIFKWSPSGGRLAPPARWMAITDGLEWRPPPRWPGLSR